MVLSEAAVVVEDEDEFGHGFAIGGKGLGLTIVMELV